MSDTTDPRETMAAELALGLLEGEERAAALRRLLAEPGFAAEVETWQARLAPLTGEIAEQAPPEGMWPRIERALGVPGTAIVRRLNRWRALALVSTGIAASLAAFVMLGPIEQPSLAARPMMVAQIAAPDAGPVMLASYDAGTRRFRLTPTAMPEGGRIPELWLIPADGRPRSLGVFDPTRMTEMEMPEPMVRLIGADASLAVSMEPLGGSPTGQPTGPVVASGKMLAI